MEPSVANGWHSARYWLPLFDLGIGAADGIDSLGIPRKAIILEALRRRSHHARCQGNSNGSPPSQGIDGEDEGGAVFVGKSDQPIAIVVDIGADGAIGEGLGDLAVEQIVGIDGSRIPIIDQFNEAAVAIVDVAGADVAAACGQEGLVGLGRIAPLPYLPQLLAGFGEAAGPIVVGKGDVLLGIDGADQVPPAIVALEAKQGGGQALPGAAEVQIVGEVAIGSLAALDDGTIEAIEPGKGDEDLIGDGGGGDGADLGGGDLDGIAVAIVNGG